MLTAFYIAAVLVALLIMQRTSYVIIEAVKNQVKIADRDYAHQKRVERILSDMGTDPTMLNLMERLTLEIEDIAKTYRATA